MIAIATTSGLEGEILNLGSNFEVSIGDLAQTIADLMQQTITIKEDEQRIRPKDSEVERLWADNSKALEKLSWTPAYSGLDGFKSGLQQTIDWFSQKDNLQRYKADKYNV